MSMELEGEDGSIITIRRGSKQQLGRGPGIAANDATVSRRQILAELPDSEVKGMLNGNDTDANTLYVQVLGPNPICIVRDRKCVTESLQNPSSPLNMTVVFLKKGEKSWLSVGDKISLSIKQPVFFTYKEKCYSTENEDINFIQRTYGTPEGLVLDKQVEPSKDNNLMSNEGAKTIHEHTPDDLLAKWEARKKGKSVAKKLDRSSIIDDEGITSKGSTVERSSKEEEEGIAEAVARRQRKAADRYQQQWQANQQQLPKQAAAKNLNTEFEVQFQGTQKTFQQIDPVKEFGFLVEGREFEQYDKHRRHNSGYWDWNIGRKDDEGENDDQDDDNMKSQHQTRECKRKSNPGKSTSKGKAMEEEDEEWMGEDENEELKVRNVKVPKTSKKMALRYQDPTLPAPSNTQNLREGNKNQFNSGDTQDEDTDDETLGGFIVEDNEDEDLNEDVEEEDWSDDDEIDDDDDDDDDDENMYIKQKGKRSKGQKPICKYGKNCYRKSKSHLEQYEHPS